MKGPCAQVDKNECSHPSFPDENSHSDLLYFCFFKKFLIFGSLSLNETRDGSDDGVNGKTGSAMASIVT